MDGQNTGISPASDALPPALTNAISLWADATTDAGSARRRDLVRDKRSALVGTQGKAVGFFIYSPLPVQAVSPGDVKAWTEYLETSGLSASSVYSRVSKLSSFYDWLLAQEPFREQIPFNPVALARPKAPRAYQNESAKSLSDADAVALIQTVRDRAQDGDLNALRDYAILRFFFATGKRRNEIMSLRWGDVEIQQNHIVVTARHKGGIYGASEVADPGVRAALFDYMQATGRWHNERPRTNPEDPLWLRHDRAAKGHQIPLSSHGFAKALKRYAQATGIEHIHLHQLRHTVARMVGEDSGDLAHVQTVLGHQNIATTRVYLQRVSVKKDRHSRDIAARLEAD